MLMVSVPSDWREMTGSIRNLFPHFHVLASPGLYEYSWKLHHLDGAPWWEGVFARRGDVDEESMRALRDAHLKQRTDMGELGYHTCRICGRYQDRGEFNVQANRRKYFLPRMILHYIEVHGYRPPEIFLSDLITWSRQQTHRNAE